MDVFDLLPVSAVIDGKVLCVHGGLSPHLNTLDQVRALPRGAELPQEGPLADLMWSDPEDDLLGWTRNPRGAGWLFGSDVTKQFCALNGLDLMCRAHQLVMEGIKWTFEDTLVTVWSAPNYCYRSGNSAAILTFDESLRRDVKLFDASKESKDVSSSSAAHYFL